MIYATGLIGVLPVSLNAATNLNAAANWCGQSFVAKGKTLSTVRMYVSAVTGTPAATDTVAHLQLDVAGVPNNTTIESRASDSAAVGWHNFAGFTTALTAGQRYWIVFKNIHATPASNYVQLRTQIGSTAGMTVASNYGWARRLSTNSGTSWGSASGSIGWRLMYSDTTYDGFPLTDYATGGAGDGIYSAREGGVRFMTPDTVSLEVVGAIVQMANQAGTPTGNLRVRLYSGVTPALEATSYDLLPQGAVLTSDGYVAWFFASPVVLTPATTYRLTVGETTQSDTSGNRYNLRFYQVDTDAASKAMFGFGNGLAKTYYDGSTWADTDTEFPAFALYLAPGAEFGAGGGGGTVVGPIFGGQVVR